MHLRKKRSPIAISITVALLFFSAISTAANSPSESGKSQTSEESAVKLETGLILDKQRINILLAKSSDDGDSRRILIERLLNQAHTDRPAAAADHVAEIEKKLGGGEK